MLRLARLSIVFFFETFDLFCTLHIFLCCKPCWVEPYSKYVLGSRTRQVDHKAMKIDTCPDAQTDRVSRLAGVWACSGKSLLLPKRKFVVVEDAHSSIHPLGIDMSDAANQGPISIVGPDPMA